MDNSNSNNDEHHDCDHDHDHDHDHNHNPASGEEQLSEQFWAIIDTFIDLANEHVQAGKGDNVDAAMSYAAARFSAFVVASNSESGELLAEEKSSASTFFTERFQKMLEDNLDDYIENFSEYTQQLEE